MLNIKHWGLLAIMLVVLTACGGGDSSVPPTKSDDPAPKPDPTYTIGGKVSGLNGDLVLQNNAGDDLSLVANGTFSFATAIADTKGYTVTIKSKPASQSCTVTNGSGIVVGTDVTNVAINCVTNYYTIGGMVSGLNGSLVLQNNGGDDLSLDADGDFTFATAIVDTTGYAVTIKSKPPSQSCTVTHGSGTVAGADVTSVAINCVINYLQRDALFGQDGVALFNGASTDSGNAMTTDASGRILVTGTSLNSNDADMMILRYNSDGTLDTGFGQNGVVVFDSGDDDDGRAITLDVNGKILVTGRTGTQDNIAIWRFHADGSPDTDFGTAGLAVYDSGHDDYSYGIETDSLNRVLVAASVSNETNYDMVVLRYDPDGTLDSSFGSSGLAIYDSGSNDNMRAIVVDGNEVLVTGYNFSGTDYDMVILRYDANGSPVAGFGTGGIVEYDSGKSDYGNDISLDDTGRILIGGYRGAGGDYDMVIWRYLANGSPDTSFDTDGIAVYTGAGSYSGNKIAVESTGKILIKGKSDETGDNLMTLWRYNADGTLDSDFGSSGKLFGGSKYVACNDMTLDTTNRILLTGSRRNGVGSDMLLARYNASGPDSSFAIDGLVVQRATAGGIDETAKALISYADGSMLVAGEYTSTSHHGLVIWRYLADGTPDVAFGDNGAVIPIGSGGYEKAYVNDMSLDSDGNILLVAQARKPTQAFKMVIWRFKPDGSHDDSFLSSGWTAISIGGWDLSDSLARYSITTDSAKRILIAGSLYTGVDENDMAIWCLLDNGSPDLTFGTDGDGIVKYNGAKWDIGHAITVDSADRILVTGYMQDSDAKMAIWRYLADGTADPDFGHSGMVVYDSIGKTDAAWDIHLDATDNILVMGTSSDGTQSGAAIWRYLDDGTADSSFANNGIMLDSHRDHTSFKHAAFELDAAGNILVAGKHNNGSDLDMGIWRYHSDGTPDMSLGVNGLIGFYDAGHDERAYELAIDADGKIVVVGESFNGRNKDMTIWRYEP